MKYNNPFFKRYAAEFNVLQCNKSNLKPFWCFCGILMQEATTTPNLYLEHVLYSCSPVGFHLTFDKDRHYLKKHWSSNTWICYTNIRQGSVGEAHVSLRSSAHSRESSGGQRGGWPSFSHGACQVVLLRRRRELPEDVVPRLEQPGLRLTDKRSPN